MCDVSEILFASNANDQMHSCNAWDYKTGTNLMLYKGGGSAAPHSLNLLKDEYLITANSTKPILHVWPLNDHQQYQSVRFVVPGQVHALALSNCSFFLVAGVLETLYIWHLPSGRLLNTIAKHYQAISCLQFNDIGSHFVSAGKDGGVNVWNLTQVAALGDDNQKPLYSFNDHGLPVTDVHIGIGGLRAFMFTVSLDRTCKVYDLAHGDLLLSVVFAEGLQSMLTNVLETRAFIGSVEGTIYEFGLDAPPRMKEYHVEQNVVTKFVGHKAGTAVNCMALGLDGVTLISGGQDQQICIWHIPSRQLIKTMLQKGAITNLKLILGSASVFNAERKMPRRFINNLARMVSAPELDDEFTVDVLVTENTSSLQNDFDDELSFASTASAQAATDSANQPNADEVAKLRAQVAELKHINHELFQTAVEHVLKPNNARK